MDLFAHIDRMRADPRYAAYREAEAALDTAHAEAYRKRSGIYSVRMNQATHDRLAECEQQWREEAAARFEHAPPAPKRNPDGTPPSLATVFGYAITVDDHPDDGVRWDTGPEPLAPFPAFTGTAHPGPGRRFAPDAEIASRGSISAHANPDGTLTVTWHPDARP